ncbi:MAG: ATP-grasp domain-containing protein [Pseudobdellovibrionaceae bacterium]
MKIGVLGGGQLGRMLWQASLHPQLKDKIEVLVYNDNEDCPAHHAGAKIFIGDFKDSEKLAQFFSTVDTFTLENEFLDCDILESAWLVAYGASTTNSGQAKWTPPLAGIRIAQDKLKQKKLYQSLHLPTSEFQEFDIETYKSENFLNILLSLRAKWNGLVLKKSRMGYDGKGNFFIPANSSFSIEALNTFCDSAAADQSMFYVEQMVPFLSELALVSSRDRKNNLVHFPLVQTEQTQGTCHWAYRAQVSTHIEAQAQEIAKKVADELNILGTFALEFFLTKNNSLFINEMAPRVHNSGHFSLSTGAYSQFALHLKSYLPDLSVTAEDCKSDDFFVMLNLLGPDSYKGPCAKPSHPQIYWYDKHTSSPRRKLGHVNLISSDKAAKESLFSQLKKIEAEWQNTLRSK